MRQKFIILTAFSFLSVAVLYSCDNSGANQTDKTEPTKTEVNYMAVGNEMAAETQSVLAKNLVNAISTGGAENALEFCNINATLLTDSMSKVLNTAVKRVTDFPRNRANLANEREQEFIQTLKSKILNGEKPEPKMLEIGGTMVGYYPIITNQMCLQCHGAKEIDINTPTFKKINTLYPLDKAIGYKVNQVRGLWVVGLSKN